jgi:hypothetical protein
MDCEKFEPLLLDELYEELDELTSAGVKRHVSGCARCAGILNGMKATRRAAALPIMAVPIGLEERILAAAKDAQKQANVVVPFRAKASRALTVAGRWAMRPQTAMAAVFLLMIGTSAFLIRSNPRATKDSAVSVTVEGSPAPVAQAAAPEAMDPNAAASAHGPATPIYTRPPPPPAATVAIGDGPVDRMTNGYGRDNDGVAIGSALAKEEKSKDQGDPYAIANAAPPAGAPAAAPMADSMTQAPSRAAGKGGSVSDPASLGAAAFQARNYAEAARQYDLAAKTGDLNSELWAAESVKQGQGCAVALGRFDALSKKDAGNYFGNEASLRAARCQIAMGQTDAAKTRLVALQSSSTHAQQAQTEMNNLNQALAARQAGGGTGVHAAAAPKKAAAPARPAPAKPSMDAEKQRQLDRNDAY